MVELSVRDFGAYFEAVHSPKPLPSRLPASTGADLPDDEAIPRVTPFPWQSRLLEKVVSDGRWPELLDLPTGTGKTAAIDIALFHLALDAARPAQERTAPRRIVMVVDRRTVVDQAFERAEKIQKALAEATDGVLKIVADRLRAFSGARETDPPLALAQLRGGMPRDDAWAKRPDQPVVAVSTVDQVGSRLLFRGYGVSEAMRPIHAGLLGNDTLLLLDEVHLSEPFRQTLDALLRYRRRGKPVLPDRWQFVQMSATPASSDGAGAQGHEKAFGLNDEDRRDERLARRLAAKKPVELAPEVKVSGAEIAKRKRFAEECAERAVPFATPCRAVGVIVNRVATAREVFAEMRKRLGGAARVFLVTGRMRPLDRNDLDKEIGELVRSGRQRRAADPPVVVVSTQCIEAGADFDFDAIVTECASLDALRQRFGRLNRLGEIDNARGVVLVRSDTLKDRDPIYGTALTDTWKWLSEGARDFGIDAMGGVLPAGETLKKLLSPKADAPVMLPAHLDAWVQTMPVPVVDPDVSLWLHGIGQEQLPEVQIVWRADVTETLLQIATHDKQVAEQLYKRIEACPPVGLEAISVPIYAARAWLRGDDEPELADVEGRSATKEDDREREPRGRGAIWWKGDDSLIIAPDKILPGSTLVVPSTYGGIAYHNWDPSAKDVVSDRGDQARWEQTRRPTLRLHPNVLRLSPDADSRWPEAPTLADPDHPDQKEDDRNSADDWLDRMRAVVAEESWRHAALKALPSKGRKRCVLVRQEGVPWEDSNGERKVESGYMTLVGRFRADDQAAGDVTTEGDGGSLTGVEITLSDHLAGVASWAKHLAKRCGLPDAIAGSVEAAARWHDLGKVDPRFQRLLCGGDDSRAAVVAEPLAKSKIVLADRAARNRAFKRSGYPRGTRHELSSVAMLEPQMTLLGEHVDRELVLHLVASHHGFCRPFAPVAEADPNPVELTFELAGTTLRASSHHGLERLDSGIADRFWRLVGRYGWFGLAWLEAILRLADHRRSEQEQSDPDAKEAP